MSYRDGPHGSHCEVEMAGLVASSFLVRDFPDATDAERIAAAHEVDLRVRRMPDVMRLGVRVAGAVSYVVLTILAMRPFHRLAEERRADLVARLAGVPLPVVGEYVRLTRGLGLASVVEARTRRGGERP